MSNIIFTLFPASRGYGMNLILQLFAALDGAIFTLFSLIIKLMFAIVDVSASESLYDSIFNRIYVILSIYMLFKVTVSLITYLVNPDTLTDKSQGVGKLVQRVMLAMMILVIFPIAFTRLGEYQKHILRNGTIDNIILGSNSISSDVGDKIGTSVYDGFIIYETGKKGKPVGLKKVSDVSEYITKEKDDKHKNVYKYDYLPLIGFALGVFMSLLMLSFCIDVAIRAFKLVILQFIAPIPIISYIDPKSAKDGAFSKWLKTYFSTWASLFVRIIVIDFILLMINNVTKGTGLENADNFYVKIALIIGLLFFAKNLPKFIYDALGIKQPERGLFTGLGNIAGAAAIGAGVIGAGVASGRASYMADEALNKDHNAGRLLKNVGAGLFGAAGGLGAGIGAATSAKDHNARAVNEALAKRNQLALRRGAAGSTGLGRTKESLSQMLTGQTAFDRRRKEVEGLDSMVKNVSTFQSNLKSEATKGKYGQVTINGGGGYLGDQKITGNSKTLRAEGQMALSRGEEWYYHDNGDGTTAKIATKEFERIAGDMEKGEMESLYALFQSGDEATIEANPDLYGEYQSVIEEVNATGGGYSTATSKDLDNSKKQAAADSYATKSTREYKAGQANSNEVKR